MSRKIITTEERKSPIAIIVLIALVAIIIPLTIFLIKGNKKEDIETNDGVAVVEGDSSEDLTLTENNQDPDSIAPENGENDNQIVSPEVDEVEMEENTGDIEDDSNEDIVSNEDPNEGKEQWQIGKEGPQNPKPKIELTPEEIAKSKTGGYYDGAWVPENEICEAMIGIGYSSLPEWIPRFYDVDALELVKDVKRPEYSESTDSVLTLETLKSIDRTNERNLYHLSSYEEYYNAPIYEIIDEVRMGNKMVMDDVEASIGVRGNEEYYEQLIISGYNSLRNKLYSEAKNENNPNKYALRAAILRAKVDTDSIPHFETGPNSSSLDSWYKGISYWLEHGGEIKPIEPWDYSSEYPCYSSIIFNDIYHKNNMEDFKVVYMVYNDIVDEFGNEKVLPAICGVLDGVLYNVGFNLENGELKFSTISIY